MTIDPIDVVDSATVRFDGQGLVLAIVQDAATGTVLMLAWMDREALEATARTGEVHFHSRSRGQLWRKGETSGNVVHAVDVRVDCDGAARLGRGRAAVRRGQPSSPEVPVVTTAHFTVDLAGHRVTDAHGDVRLTPTEWHLLEVLARAQGRMVGQRQLLHGGWGPACGWGR